MAISARLFVYGTLKSTTVAAMGRDMRARLQAEASLLGTASTTGQLFDLGRYPALIASSRPTDIVHGEVHELRDAVATLSWLDDYEGISRPPRLADEYARVEHRVRLDGGGAALNAWVYLYNRAVTGLRPVANGRWPAER